MQNRSQFIQVFPTDPTTQTKQNHHFKALRRTTVAPVTQSTIGVPDATRAILTRLDTFKSQFDSQFNSDDVSNLFEFLSTLRWQSSAETWTKLRNQIKCHALGRLVHQDPCTRRSYQKPRGYAGDAVLIDYLYRLNDDYQHLSRIERQLLDIVTNRPSAIAVRERLDIATQRISEILQKKPTAKIVSLACGHFRELLPLQHTHPIDRATIVGIDQDPDSLATIKTALPNLSLSLVNASVMHLIKGHYFAQTSNADLFYALGLFDYLSDSLAQRLIALMFGRLNPGGTVLITNFTPKNPDIGYMETFMDWPLKVRESADIYGFTNQIPQHDIAEIKLYRGTNDCIWYLELKKR